MSNAPKAFISYSWSSLEHEEWVMQLARDLYSSGIEAILDKWDLREGDEASAFMERMTADPSVTNVIVVSDRLYTEKSNARKGGAGTEAQIISQKVFEGNASKKFVVLVREFDEAGKPFVPAYYSSRLFIDFSDDAKRSEKFEQLIRWVFDKPLFEKPELGTAPHYITDPSKAIKLLTSVSAQRAQDAIRNGKPIALGATKEYFDLLAREIERFRPKPDTDMYGDGLTDLLSDFIPYRNEFLDLVSAIASYTDDDRHGVLLRQFFEKMVDYFYAPEGLNSWGDSDFDIFRFFGWELFLHTMSVFLHNDRPNLFLKLAEAIYIPEGAERRYGAHARSYDVMCEELRLFDRRNEKLRLGRASLEADFLKERAVGSPSSFEALMECDFILYLRGAMTGAAGWRPRTLGFRMTGSPMRIFQRAKSQKELTKLLSYLGVGKRDDIGKFIQKAANREVWVPRFGWRGAGLDLPAITGFDDLGTYP